MKHELTLKIMSLLSLLFMIVHMTQDVIAQSEGSVLYPIPVVIFAVWLYGTLMLSGRVSGYVIMLLGGFFGTGMIVIHASGLAVGKSGGFFSVFTLFVLSTTSWVTIILAARGLAHAAAARRQTNGA